MAPSPDAYALARKFEGLRLEAYPDPGTRSSPWTIGYGHTRGVRQGDTCTEEQADAWLDEDLLRAAALLNAWFPYAKPPAKPWFSQSQFDALCDFVFNVGPGVPGSKDGFVWLRSGSHSTIFRLCKAQDWANVSLELPKWCYAAGQELPGLKARRMAEQNLFLQPAAPILTT